MHLGLSEILELVEKEENLEKKIEILRKWDTTVLRDLFIFTFHPNIKFLLPEGNIPEGIYKLNPMPHCEGILYSEMKKMYIFVEGGNPNLSQLKREHLWISLLEKVDAKDSMLLINMKDKKLPYLSVTPELINLAFPDLLPLDLIQEHKKIKEIIPKKEENKIIENKEELKEVKIVKKKSKGKEELKMTEKV